MTNDELTQLLYDQPMSRLHRLARGRVPRHFRMGKHRIIQSLLEIFQEKPTQRIKDQLGFLIQNLSDF